VTLEEASKIIDIWGKYLEFENSRFMLLFLSSIPESFLPFPKVVIEEASNMMAKYHHNNGNKAGADAMQAASSWLIFYNDDEESLSTAAKMWSDPKWLESVLPKFKKQIQQDWEKRQKDFYKYY